MKKLSSPVKWALSSAISLMVFSIIFGFMWLCAHFPNVIFPFILICCAIGLTVSIRNDIFGDY